MEPRSEDFQYFQCISIAVSRISNPQALGSSGNSGYSNVASASTYAAPAVVSSLTATSVSRSQINLSWSDVAGETGYQLQRSPDGVSSWTQIAQLGADVTTFSDTARPSVATYYYRVRATGVCALAGPFSAVAQATTGGTITAPGSLAAKATSWTKVKLTWVDKSNNEQGFSLERSSVKTFASVTVFTIDRNAIAFTDTTVTAKTTFYYRLRAFVGPVYSAYTSTVSVTMPADSTKLVPPAPSSLAAATMAGPVNKLTWKDNSVYELGFKIQRSPTSTFATVDSFAVSQNVTAFLDSTGLGKGIKYYYRVRSFNGAGSSAWTSSVSVTASTATASASVAADVPAAPAAVDAELTVVRLGNAAPNPFAQRSTITFELPTPAVVDLGVFDLSGRRIANLASGLWAAGRHQAQWDGRDQNGRSQASGVFFVRLATGRHVETHKLILAR